MHERCMPLFVCLGSERCIGRIKKIEKVEGVEKGDLGWK